MEEKILKEIFYNGRSGVSFVELENHVPGFKGDFLWGIDEKNIWFWANLSKEATGALTELKLKKLIGMTPTSPLVYMIDGKELILPIAKQNRKYKTERWMPVVFNLTQEGLNLVKKLIKDDRYMPQ